MRDLRIDVFRGLLILTVVLGHTDYLPKPLLSTIYSFHMPSFFILSGYLFNVNSKVDVFPRIISKFKRLIVPAWVLGILCGIPFSIGLFIDSDSVPLDVFNAKLLGTLIGYPTWSNTFNCTPIWFLFSLFMTEMIAILLISKTHRISALYIVGAIGVLASLYIKSYTFFNVAISMSGMLFFAVGATVRRLGVIERVVGVVPAISALTIFYFLRALAPENVNMAANTLGNDATGIALSSLCAISGCVLAFNFAVIFSKVKYINDKTAWLGVNTMVVIAFDYYANNIIASVHYYLGVHAYYEVNFVLKVLLLSFVAYIVSSIKPLDLIINRGGLKLTSN